MIRSGGNIMWKCKFCDKTNFDDQKICPYCNAPNPDAQKTAPQTPAQPQNGMHPPAQDWASRYNPDPKSQKSPIKLDAILKIMVIAASALLIIYLATLIFKQPSNRNDAANPAPTEESSLKAGDVLDAKTADTPMPTETPEPTRAPVVAEAVTELYLDFGQTYQCSTDDFNLPIDIPAADITWSCAENDAGTECSKDGLIAAGYYQVDPEMKYNDEVIVTGTTAEGSTLTYHVFTGDGQTYTFDWSNSARSMRGYISGYTIVSDKMLVQCDGFSMYYKYELTKGKLEANAWSVWVREDGTTWVRVQDIKLQNQVGDTFDIEFDYPMTFNEIWIMPESYSMEYSYSSSFSIGYLLF